MNLLDRNSKCKEESNLFYKHRGVLVIKPDAYLNIGKVINQIEESGFSITNFKVARLNKS